MSGVQSERVNALQVAGGGLCKYNVYKLSNSIFASPALHVDREGTGVHGVPGVLAS